MKRIALFFISLLMLLGRGVDMYAAPTAGSVAAGDKTVNYTYEFTESGTSVTFAVTITSITDGDGNSATLDALVKPAFYNGATLLQAGGGAITIGQADTYTLTSQTAGTKLNMIAKYDYAAGGSFQITADEYTVVGDGSSAVTPVNLALNRTTKATSGEASASLAVDGGITGDSRWESDHGKDPQYWQVDLGSSQTFNTIKIVWEGAYGKTFTIEAGDNVDGQGWLTGGTTIASVTGQTFPNTQTIYVDNTTARYIKFNGIERGTGYGYSFWEFEVYNDESNAPTSINITGNNETLIGGTLQFTASGTDAGSNVVTPGVTWSSSDTSVGTIDAKTGLFTGVAAGTTNITASLGGVTSNSITVTVINAVAPTDVPNIITSYNDGTETYTIDSDQLIKIFTVSGNATGFHNESHNVTITSTTINDKQVLMYENFKIAGAGFGEIALKDNMEYLHVDVYPMQPMTMAFFLNNGGHGKGAQRTLAVGEWNSLTIPLSEFNIPETTGHFIMAQNTNDSGAENPGGAIDNLTLYIGNIYYFKTESVADATAPVMQTATVSNVNATTATLTVNATDDKAGTLTYKVYNGSVADANLLTTGTGTAGANATINLTLTELTTYNLVVTATDAAGKTSEAMSVAEFTTPENYTPVLTTIQVIMKGESTDGYNASPTGKFERTIRIIALDQKGEDMPARTMSLRITDGNTGTNDVSFVNDVNPQTVLKDADIGSTAIHVNNHVGRVTVEAVDAITGMTGYGFLTFYDATNTDATNTDLLISNPNIVSDAKTESAYTNIITLDANNGHGSGLVTTNGTKGTVFTLNWSDIQENSQTIRYYDIDMIQVLYQNGNFPNDYTISVSHDGGQTYEDVYHYDGTQNMYVANGYRADVWNSSRQNTQAVSHVKFTSNTTGAITFDAFKVYGKLNSSTDNTAPYDLYAGLVDQTLSTDQTNKTSTAKIWLECKDNKSATVTYTITSATGMQYTISGPTGGGVGNQVQYDFSNTLVPGTHYVFTIVASDGRNKSEATTVEFTTPALNSAPVVDAHVPAAALESTYATIEYWLPTDSNTGIANADDIIFVVKNGTAIVGEAHYAKSEVTGENNKKEINLTGLTPDTDYTLTVTATHSSNALSSTKAVSFRTLSAGNPLKIWFDAANENVEGSFWKGRSGQLEYLITDAAHANTTLNNVTELHIEGALNSEDVKVLRQMAGGAPRIGNGNIKTRVYIKADYEPYLYAWKGADADKVEYLGGWPGTKLTKQVNGYYVYEFTDTDINIVMNNGIGGKTPDINNLSGDNYFIYYNGNGHDGTGVTHEIGDYAHLGNLATLDLAEASFFQDGNTFVSRWENNAYLPCAFSNNHTNTFSVDGYMFYDCDKLQTVTLPTAASANKQIGVYAFHDCDGLVTVNLPSDLVTIAGYAFENCENLGEVTLPSTLESIGYRAFCDSHKVTLHDAQLPNSITTIDDLAFGNTSITEVHLPVNPGYTTVNGAAFGWNGKLKTLVIPANVTTMKDGVFRECGILDDVTIADDAVITSIGEEAFLADHALPSVTANRLMRDITVLRKGVFQNCTSLDNINIPAAVTNIYDLAFAGCTGLNSVTVNSATAPDGYTVTDGKMVDNKNNKVDPFNNVNPNNLTLHFEGDALAGYKSYRSGTAESNTFKRLLTKTLGETATNYNVAGQMHADVVLNRTMKEGWNTVALPFGVKNGDAASEVGRDREGKAAQVYAAAFNVADGDGFMIATYRGEENGVFKFLKHGDYAIYGFDEFEPLLIKMASSNLNAENKYTFVDVDLNYDTEQNKLYRENNADEAVPTKRWTGSEFVDFFGSNYNHDWEWFSRTTDGYAFTGTYYTQTSADVTAEGSFIKEGDYIIQNDMFYQVVSTKQYGMRGYRAWFHDRGVGTGAKPETLMFTVYERPEATEIDEPTDPDDPNEPIIVDKISAIDSLSITPQDIYTLGGQLVRKNATTVDGLAKGMYIMGGKKIVVE